MQVEIYASIAKAWIDLWIDLSLGIIIMLFNIKIEID